MATLSDPGRPDWRYVQNGAVTLFWRKHIFLDAREHLIAAGYSAPIIDCTSLESFKLGLSAALSWSDLFGTEGWNGHLDTLNDGMGSYSFSDSDRTVFCIEQFDVIAHQHSRIAHQTLDIIEHQARNHLLDGRILLAFVQTNDPRYRADNLGARSANWNDREWSNVDRDL